MHYATSDLHGYPLKDFRKLLAKAGFTEDDELFVLGDVVDRNGDGGIETLRWMMDQPNIRFILGNHEDLLLQCRFLFDRITKPEKPLLTDEQLLLAASWLRNGAEPTIRSLTDIYCREPKEFDRIMDYLYDAPLYSIRQINGRKYVLVHAGLGHYEPGKHPYEYADEDLLWTRPSLDERWSADETVILGHTPTQYYGAGYRGRMIRTETWIDIDTGAAAGGSPMLLRLEDETPFYADEDDLPEAGE
ncbi:MAG: metallophosphoesterase [Clostridia bacterium]|nr:metallophosphoesterase [Clostridia bacterium]